METRKPLYIFSPRCLSCGKLLHIFAEYHKELLESKKRMFTENDIENKFVTIDTYSSNDTDEYKLLEKMGIFRYCCRSTLLTTSKNKTMINYDIVKESISEGKPNDVENVVENVQDVKNVQDVENENIDKNINEEKSLK